MDDRCFLRFVWNRSASLGGYFLRVPATSSQEIPPQKMVGLTGQSENHETKKGINPSKGNSRFFFREHVISFSMDDRGTPMTMETSQDKVHLNALATQGHCSDHPYLQLISLPIFEKCPGLKPYSCFIPVYQYHPISIPIHYYSIY